MLFALLTAVLAQLPAVDDVFVDLEPAVASEQAQAEKKLLIVAFFGDDPDADFEALWDDEALLDWLGAHALCVRAETDVSWPENSLLRTAWAPAISASLPFERVRRRVDDWSPEGIVSWLEHVRAGRGSDDYRANLPRSFWELQQAHYEWEQWISQGRAAEVVDGLLARWQACPEDERMSNLSFIVGAYENFFLNYEPAWEAFFPELIAVEQRVRGGARDAETWRQWLWFASLLGEEGRVVAFLEGRVAQGRWLPTYGPTRTPDQSVPARATAELYGMVVDAGPLERIAALLPDLAAYGSDHIAHWETAAEAAKELHDMADETGSLSLRGVAVAMDVIGGPMENFLIQQASRHIARVVTALCAGGREAQADALAQELIVAMDGVGTHALLAEVARPVLGPTTRVEAWEAEAERLRR